MANVEAGGIGSGGLVIPALIGNQYAAVTLNSASGTSPGTLITGAPGYYLTQIGFQCDPTATLAAGGMETVVLSDSVSGTVAQFRIYIPASAGAPAVPTIIRQVNDGPFVWNNKSAGSVLTAALGTALTAGSIRVFARYGLCNYLG
ncbi:hypothetical protein [Burkholderia aenigmatica]|uniref:hypothetical protein n=1 Tax=Burkholderia aenigmatica TaxID=2015348 RepID=UPI0026521C9A|nr:hypothetical protein [Burkholderia aenigmatica]MDN7881250.1 hypothetical protein [Burkholderia aenigmatica]